MLLTSSSSGTARSLGYPSARPSSSGIAYTWNLGIWHPGTINLRLGAMRRPANEASDCGLLSPDMASGIRRVKGVKKIGVRLGNWLTPEQAERLWNAPDSQLLKGKRDRALLAVLLACGLRRHEAVSLDFRHVQQRNQAARFRIFTGRVFTRNSCASGFGCRPLERRRHFHRARFRLFLVARCRSADSRAGRELSVDHQKRRADSCGQNRRGRTRRQCAGRLHADRGPRRTGAVPFVSADALCLQRCSERNSGDLVAEIDHALRSWFTHRRDRGY
jgi:integrase